MLKNSPAILLLLSLALLSACSTTSTLAPVVDRADSARVVHNEPGMYTVRKGDTLYRIALDNAQNYRDLVTWNRLTDPNDIKVGQVLRVASPEADTVATQTPPGVQTSAVTMPPDTSSVTAQTPKKSTPRGDKQPYSDATLAQLQRSDGTPATGVKPTAPAAPVAPVAPVTPPVVAGNEKMSWIWPSAGKVVGTFDEGKNKGIDIAGKAGQQVMAAGAGKVMYAGSGIRGYGNLVIVKHSNSLLSAYAHNRSIVVKEGQSVNQGQMIAEMGDSDSDTVKLHFEIRQQGKPVDPSKFLPVRQAAQ